jgi:hypothetical protein
MDESAMRSIEVGEKGCLTRFPIQIGEDSHKNKDANTIQRLILVFTVSNNLCSTKHCQNFTSSGMVE